MLSPGMGEMTWCEPRGYIIYLLKIWRPIYSRLFIHFCGLIIGSIERHKSLSRTGLHGILVWKHCTFLVC